jgi:hypothetical protein
MTQAAATLTVSDAQGVRAVALSCCWLVCWASSSLYLHRSRFYVNNPITAAQAVPSTSHMGMPLTCQ